MNYRALSTLDILKAIKTDEYAKRYFIGVFPRDKLPQAQFKYPYSLIMNTDTSENKGQHWLAMHYDTNKYCTFFDSYGNSPKFYKLDNYIKQTSSDYEWNRQQIQDPFSVVCGHYCIFFILMKSRGFELNEINNLFFKNNFNINDYFIGNLLN